MSKRFCCDCGKTVDSSAVGKIRCTRCRTLLDPRCTPETAAKIVQLLMDLPKKRALVDEAGFTGKRRHRHSRVWRQMTGGEGVRR